MKINLLIGVLILGVSGHAHAGWERLSPTTIQLTGEVGISSYEEYTDVAASGYMKVILDSPGGTPLVALKIAEDISSRDVEVVVDGICASACANYLALAGNNLTVACDSIVGWHGTLPTPHEAAIEMQAQGEPDDLIKAKAKWLTEFHDREQRYLKKVGVSFALLTDSVQIVRDDNIAPVVSFELDQTTGDYSVSRSASLWIPTVKVLREYGVNTSGFCGQQTRDDIVLTLEKRGWKILFSSNGRKVNTADSTERGK